MFKLFKIHIRILQNNNFTKIFFRYLKIILALTMDSQNIKSGTPNVEAPNKNSHVGLTSSTLAQTKPSATSQLNFKQSKPVAPYDPKNTCSSLKSALDFSKNSKVVASTPLLTSSYDQKNACSKPEPPLIPSKNCEIIASGPFLTYQNAQKYLQSPTTPQSADQNGSMSQYLVQPQGNMMNTAMPYAMNASTNSTYLFFNRLRYLNLY